MDAEASVNENEDGGVVTAVATENASEVTVDNEHFEVADGNLKLKAGNMLDFESDESPIEVTITATSSGGDATATVSISITDVNEAPSIDVRDGEEVPMHEGVISSLTIAENAMKGDEGVPPLALIEVMDPDAGEALIGQAAADSVTITGEQADKFQVILDPVDGLWLHLADGASLDFEEDSEVTVTVTYTDQGGLTASQDVTVMVTDVNEGPDAPVVVDADNLSVDENDPGASITSVEATTDPEGDTDITYHVDDDRFEISSGRVLKLKDGMSLNHESESYVMVTVSATDSDGNEGAGTTVTVHVNDVNEGPDVTGTVMAVTGVAGDELEADPIDLLALFSDPDDGDAVARYTSSGTPSWLTFSVQYGEDADGSQTAHGILEGTPPVGDDSVNKITITASDSDGASGSISFYVIVDDGNDEITDVDLIDDAGNVAVEADVDENDASGVVFGEIRVQDQDHAMHPHGTHLIQVLRGDTRSESPNAPQDSRFEVKYDDAGIPWLVLKEGMSLDFEDRQSPGAVDVTIRAVDLNGATHPPARGGGFMGNVEFQTVTIVINDQNDAPKANTIGNWWVTAERGQVADDVAAGSWLEFGLDTEGADAAFTDPDGDTLTYSLSGPSILEIDERSGVITNKKGGVPVEGVHRLTVTATDPDGESASTSFYLAIALSGDGTDATANDDNEAPRFPTTPNETPYRENSGDQRVATFRVTDNDNNLGHHPFALDSVVITSITSDVANDPMNVTLRDHDGDAATPMGLYTATADAANPDRGYAAAFVLSDPIKSGNSWTYHVYVRDTDPSPRADTTERLDAEYRDTDAATDLNSITITVSATDGVAAAVEEEVRIRITDVNEAPEAANIGDNPATPAVETDNIAQGDYGVAQSEDLKEIVYINLHEIWSDPDDGDGPEDMTFGASVSGSWIKILHGPVEWGEIDDDVTWGDTDIGDTGTPNRTAVIVGADANAPETGEFVVIIEIDRTGRNNGQDDEGSFTLTATDRGDGVSNRQMGSKTYKITPTDENLTPTNAVTLTGSAREDATLTARFNDDRDPDLAGSATPALVLYQWFRVAEDGTESTDPVRVSTSNTYKLTQMDVGSSIRVKVKYYEVFNDMLVGNDLTRVDADSIAIDSATTSRAVSNTPDKGAASITILADANALSVADENVRVTDADYSTPGGLVADTNLSISWEVSPNGRGGWEPVEGAGPGDGDNPSLTLDDEDDEKLYYRAVVTYDADGVDEDTDPSDGDDDLMETLYSDPVQASDIRDTAGTAPTTTGSAFVGGTLSVDVRNTSVQWQVQRGTDWVDIPGATGSLNLTSALAGSMVRAVVTYHSTDDDSPGVTAIVATAAQEIGGATTGNASPAGVDDHEIEASVDAPGHGMGNNAGHNLSITETVPLASLFQDPDSARLTYSVTNTAGLVTDTNSGTGTTYVYDAAAGGVLVFEASTGKLTFNSDVYQTHDGTDADGSEGGSNVITLTITATDEGARTATADVTLRINVAPTGILFNPEADGSGTDGPTVTVMEHVGSAAAPSPAGQFIAYVDVQDQNAGSHKFGTHEVTLSGDDRFMITNTGNGRRDGDMDGSTWEVRLKPGAKLDFETQADMAPTVEGKQIVLTLTATDSEGLSTPSGPGTTPIRLTITVENVTSDDPPPPDPNNVPGLEDDETTDPDNEREDDATDDDTDGGSHPPPPGMSLGGIIENFVDNMEYGDQDLLEDFLLTIDDGIDIV